MMVKKKSVKLTISAILFTVGIFMLVNSQSNITGAFLGVTTLPSSFINSFFGIIFILSSILLFATTHSGLEKITLSSAINKSPALLRLTEDAARNQKVGRELNHLVKELSKGNFKAGLNHPGHINGTNVYYLRGHGGARLYYHKTGEYSYEIVAKSAKGRNQDQVICKLEKLYKN